MQCRLNLNEGIEIVEGGIPPAALVQHTAIIGKTGSGKTSTSKLAVEQVVAEDFRVCILDTIKSDWWGITSSADGKKPGLPFTILGGPRGHVPLHSSAGAAIGQLVAEGKLPLSIIDMADFEPGGVQKFFAEFAPALMRHAKGVLYLVIEEAHEVAPKERAGFGAENLSIHWAKKLATAGRSKGIRMIVATQRVQSLHNAVLGSCDTLIAHRLTAPADKAPVISWLKSNADKQTAAEVEASMSSLPTGSAWLCSGEARIFEQIAFRKFATFDNAATPTGDDDAFEVETAPVDQDELHAIIGDAVAEAEENDPKRLKARVAELERQVASAGKAAAPDPSALRQAEERGRQAAGEDQRRVGQSEGYGRAIHDAVSALRGLRPNDAGPVEASGHASVTSVKSQLQWRSVTLPTPVAERGINVSSDDDETSDLRGGEKACLVAIAGYANGVTRPQLAVLTGYKPTSRKTFLQKLRQRGYVENAGDRIKATAAGVQALGENYESPLRGDALREKTLAKLGGGEKVILEMLIAAYPKAMSRAEIEVATGYKPTSRKTFVQKLSARELVESTSDGIKASDDLFE